MFTRMLLTGCLALGLGLTASTVRADWDDYEDYLEDIQERREEAYEDYRDYMEDRPLYAPPVYPYGAAPRPYYQPYQPYYGRPAYPGYTYPLYPRGGGISIFGPRGGGFSIRW